MRHRPTARVALATLALGISCAASTTAFAGGAGPAHRASLDKTVRFLQDSQQLNGGFSRGGEPSQGTSAWVALALAAVGINPQDQALPCGSTVYTFLTNHFREGFEEEIPWSERKIATTAFERELLVVDAAGTDPHDFSGFDLVDEILKRKLPNGSFPYTEGGRGEVNDTIFAILALSPIAEPSAEAAVARGAEWLLTEQNDDGGWYFSVRGPTSEVDMTGAAIEALVAAGAPETETQQAAVEKAQDEGFEYLEKAQLPDGGFPALPKTERESNVASTAWAVQGIWATGQNPEDWAIGSGAEAAEPLDYLESMQDPVDGHERWKASQDQNGIWMTAYVTPALAGQALPVPIAARSQAGPPRCQEATPKTETGVIAGGGGEGAPFFSRPKAESKGRTPGGARIVHGKGIQPRDHSATRRGPNTTQPQGTETEEPSKSGGEAAAVTGGGGDSSQPGTSAENHPAAAIAKAAGRPSSSDGGHEVTGTVIGSSSASGGKLAFGAFGLHSSGAGGEGEGDRVAIGIGLCALVLAGGASQWERRRKVVLP
jgi:hypothetical protein